MPEVPTIAAAGFPGSTATAGSARSCRRERRRRSSRCSTSRSTGSSTLPELKEKFAALGLDPVGGTPEDFARHMRAEGEKWAKVIKAASIKAK